LAESAPRRAVFLDRDGTICEEVGYLNHITRFRVYPFAAPAIRRLNEAGLPVVVVTNQSGVARGFFPEELVQRVHEKMAAELSAGGARVDGIYYCPHRSEDGCECRKPRGGMLEQAARDLRVTPEGSWMVSDRFADLEMVQGRGGRGILVLTGYGRGEWEWNRSRWPRQPDFVAEDLSVAVDIILKEHP
jgi:D-glycero-D-manno-heptose 1,7-bisphosphate phosphatase